MPTANSRGFTLIEMMLSLVIIATISLAMAVMFKLAMTANIYCGNETILLSSIRKAFQGNGPTPGMLFDTLSASSATATGATTLALRSPGVPNNYATTYSLSSTNLQRSTATAATLATGITNLEFSYYVYYSTGSIKKASSAADARLITISFQTSLSKGTTFYTGGVLRNHL